MLKSKGSFVVKNEKVEGNNELKEENIVHGRYLWYLVFEFLNIWSVLVVNITFPRTSYAGGNYNI